MDPILWAEICRPWLLEQDSVFITVRHELLSRVDDKIDGEIFWFFNILGIVYNLLYINFVINFQRMLDTPT